MIFSVFLFGEIAEYSTILPMDVCKTCTVEIVYKYVHGYTMAGATLCLFSTSAAICQTKPPLLYHF